MSAGDEHTCAVATTGVAYCWGHNASGELGNGSNLDSTVPVAVDGGLIFAGITVGRDGENSETNGVIVAHSCGWTADGSAYCWGANGPVLGVGLGELGNGTSIGSSVPVPVRDDQVPGGLSFSTMSASGQSACGVTTSGAAYCWGNPRNVGDGQYTNYNARTVPSLVAGGLAFAMLSVGKYSTCGLTSAGAAYCWGDNQFGELGIGQTTFGVSQSFFPVAVDGGLSFSTVSVGNAHACGVTTDGVAYCWGFNRFGELGTGAIFDESTAPVAVDGGLTFASVSAGDTFSCGLTKSGAAYCWGYNGFAVFGDGSTADSSVPVAIHGGLTFAVLSAGTTYACGVTPAGAIYCWGYNGRGQFGNGSKTSSNVPVFVAGP